MFSQDISGVLFERPPEDDGNTNWLAGFSFSHIHTHTHKLIYTHTCTYFECQCCQSKCVNCISFTPPSYTFNHLCTGKNKAAPKSSLPFSSGNWGESNAVSRALQLGSAMKAPEPPEPDAPASKSSLVSRYVLRR